jgi:hypothetical protein
MDRGLEARWCLLLRGVKKVIRKRRKGRGKRARRVSTWLEGLFDFYFWHALKRRAFH